MWTGHHAMVNTSCIVSGCIKTPYTGTSLGFGTTHSILMVFQPSVLWENALQGKENPHDLSEDSVELKCRQGITRLYTIVWPNQTHLVLFVSAPNTPNTDTSFAASSVPVINLSLQLAE